MSNKEFKHWLDMIFDCACSDKTFIGLETAKRIKARTIQLLELDTPKKPVFGTNKIIHSMGFFCPACQTRVNRGEHKYFCKCGQRLDWETDDLTQHLKSIETDESLKRVDDAYNRGWNEATNCPDVKKALDRMKQKKVIYDDSRLGKPGITEYSLAICPSCGWAVKFEDTASKFCRKCGQALDWSE